MIKKSIIIQLFIYTAQIMALSPQTQLTEISQEFQNQLKGFDVATVAQGSYISLQDYLKLARKWERKYSAKEVNNKLVEFMKKNSPFQDKINNEEKLSLDNYIKFQGTGLSQALSESLANAIDAVLSRLGEPLTGHFGMGAFQVLNELQDEGDYLLYDSVSTTEQRRFILVIKKINGELKFFVKNLPQGQRNPGTVLHLKKKQAFTFQEKADCAQKLKDKFRFEDRINVSVALSGQNQTFETIWTPNNYHQSKETTPNDQHNVKVVINDDGYLISDEGIGMTEDVFYNYLLRPRRGNKREQPSKQNNECDVYWTNSSSKSWPSNNKSKVHFLINHVAVKTVEIENAGFNYPEEIAINLPPGTWLSESRDEIEFNQDLLDSLVRLFETIIKLKIGDFDKIGLLNGLAAALQSYALADNQQVYVRNKLKKSQTLTKYCQNLRSEHTVLPNSEPVRRAYNGKPLSDIGILFLDDFLYEVTCPKDFSAVEGIALPGNNVFEGPLNGALAIKHNNTLFMDREFAKNVKANELMAFLKSFVDSSNPILLPLSRLTNPKQVPQPNEMIASPTNVTNEHLAFARESYYRDAELTLHLLKTVFQPLIGRTHKDFAAEVKKHEKEFKNLNYLESLSHQFPFLFDSMQLVLNSQPDYCVRYPDQVQVFDKLLYKIQGFFIDGMLNQKLVFNYKEDLEDQVRQNRGLLEGLQRRHDIRNVLQDESYKDYDAQNGYYRWPYTFGYIKAKPSNDLTTIYQTQMSYHWRDREGKEQSLRSVRALDASSTKTYLLRQVGNNLLAIDEIDSTTLKVKRLALLNLDEYKTNLNLSFEEALHKGQLSFKMNRKPEEQSFLCSLNLKFESNSRKQSYFLAIKQDGTLSGKDSALRDNDYDRFFYGQSSLFVKRDGRIANQSEDSNTFTNGSIRVQQLKDGNYSVSSLLENHQEPIILKPTESQDITFQFEVNRLEVWIFEDKHFTQNGVPVREKELVKRINFMQKENGEIDQIDQVIPNFYRVPSLFSSDRSSLRVYNDHFDLKEFLNDKKRRDWSDNSLDKSELSEWSWLSEFSAKQTFEAKAFIKRMFHSHIAHTHSWRNDLERKLAIMIDAEIFQLLSDDDMKKLAKELELTENPSYDNLSKAVSIMSQLNRYIVGIDVDHSNIEQWMTMILKLIQLYKSPTDLNIIAPLLNRDHQGGMGQRGTSLLWESLSDPEFTLPDSLKNIKQYIEGDIELRETSKDTMEYDTVTDAANMKNKSLAYLINAADQAKATASMQSVKDFDNYIKNSKEPKNIDKLRAEWSGIIEGQHRAFQELRELVQNSRDESVKSENRQVLDKKRIDVKAYVRDDAFVLSVRDHLGIESLERIIKVLLRYDVSDKTSISNDNALGMFGKGFFTVFDGADLVKITTGRDGKFFHIVLKVDSVTKYGQKLFNISVESLQEWKNVKLNGKDFRGTHVEKVIHLNDQTRQNVSLNLFRCGYYLQRYAGAFLSNEVEIFFNDQPRMINNRYKTLTSMPYMHEGEHQGNVSVRLHEDHRNHPGNIITVGGAYLTSVGHQDTHQFFAYVPEVYRESLLAHGGLQFDLPRSVQLTSARFSATDSHMESVRLAIAAVAYKAVLMLYYQKGWPALGLANDIYHDQEPIENLEKNKETAQRILEQYDENNYAPLKELKNQEHNVSLLKLFIRNMKITFDQAQRDIHFNDLLEEAKQATGQNLLKTIIEQYESNKGAWSKELYRNVNSGIRTIKGDTFSLRAPDYKDKTIEAISKKPHLKWTQRLLEHLFSPLAKDDYPVTFGFYSPEIQDETTANIIYRHLSEQKDAHKPALTMLWKIGMKNGKEFQVIEPDDHSSTTDYEECWEHLQKALLENDEGTFNESLNFILYRLMDLFVREYARVIVENTSESENAYQNISQALQVTMKRIHAKLLTSLDMDKIKNFVKSMVLLSSPLVLPITIENNFTTTKAFIRLNPNDYDQLKDIIGQGSLHYYSTPNPSEDAIKIIGPDSLIEAMLKEKEGQNHGYLKIVQATNPFDSGTINIAA